MINIEKLNAVLRKAEKQIEREFNPKSKKKQKAQKKILEALAQKPEAQTVQSKGFRLPSF